MKKTKTVKKTKMQNHYDIVLQLLTENEDYRKDDMLLVQKVYSDKLGKDVGKLQFKTVLNMIGKELPAIDTVCRARRKVQEEHPELIDLATQIKRKQKKQECIKFARNCNDNT